MDDASEPDSRAPGANLSSLQHPAWNLNLSSSPTRWASPGQPGQTIAAGAILALALVGNCLLLYRLRCGGCCCCGGRFRRRRKMDFLLAHLAVADIYGCGLALLSQLPPADDERVAEPGDAGWPAGDATCRLLRFLQGSGLLAPSHMLVLIALERRRLAPGPPPPAQESSPPPFVLARSALAALGWLLALLLALPQLFVYRLVPSQSGGRCLSVFPQLPRWHGQAYAVYEAVAGFVAPACLLVRTCSHIVAALGASGAEEEEPSQEGPAGPCRLELPGVAGPSPPLLLRLLPLSKCASRSPSAPRSLPRARVRALQLTLALAALFALCGFPRFILEVGLAFASPDAATHEARTTLRNMIAATNSALNPYVCLLFHSYRPWARRLQRSLCRCPDGQPRRRARHQQRLSPREAADRAELWLCPCQTKTPVIATAIQLEKEESRAVGESRF
ncbi:probable G-protein coupled receptor 150 [Erythrolamprus reginae]|uniref:probable G-protein coupled receptor 150 n=1 Tax=Erythrolamprus reginae TaxID=121349 RepID=UPI00396C9492